MHSRGSRICTFQITVTLGQAFGSGQMAGRAPASNFNPCQHRAVPLVTYLGISRCSRCVAFCFMQLDHGIDIQIDVLRSEGTREPCCRCEKMETQEPSLKSSTAMHFN